MRKGQWAAAFFLIWMLCGTADAEVSVERAAEAAQETEDTGETEDVQEEEFEAFPGTVDKETLNVRKTPSSSGKVIGRLVQGDIVHVVGEVESEDGRIWYEIEYDEDNEKTGFARSDFIKKGRYRVRKKERDLIDMLNLPVRDQRFFLQPILVVFKEGRRFPVYSGPGTDYIRGQDIAVVSTNGKIQVFGYDGKWILIQYSVMGIRLRMGYIEARYLPEEYLDLLGYPKDDKIRELEFEYRTVRVKEDTQITDDPLVGQANLVAVQEGTRVMRLGYLEGWAHVEHVYRKENGELVKVRGFIRNSLLIE